MSTREQLIKARLGMPVVADELKNIQDAAEAYLEDMIEAGESVPAEAGKVDVFERPAVAVTI